MKLALMETGELAVLFQRHEWRQQLAFLDQVSSPNDMEEADIVKMQNAIVEDHTLHLVNEPTTGNSPVATGINPEHST